MDKLRINESPAKASGIHCSFGTNGVSPKLTNKRSAYDESLEFYSPLERSGSVLVAEKFTLDQTTSEGNLIIILEPVCLRKFL